MQDQGRLIAARNKTAPRALNNEEVKLTQPFFGSGFPPNNSHGILLIHGFSATPATLSNLRKKYAALGFTISSPTLQGHGTTPCDLLTTRWQDWLSTIEAAYLNLKKQCQKITVIGHSLGGNLALQLAAKYPLDQIILITPAVYPIPRFQFAVQSGFLNLLKLLHIQWPSLGSLGGDIKKETAREIVYSKVPVNAYLELYKCMCSTQNLLSKVTAPVIIFQSRKDALVPSSRTEELLEQLGSTQKEVIWYTNSYHVLPLDNDAEDLEAQILRRLSISL